MVIKVYTSGISGNKEVKKRQQRIMMILESKNIDFEAIDITEPGRESDKQFMQDNAKARDSKHPLPPQIFNEDDYCGDYVGFDLANENDELEIFLKLPLPPAPVVIEPPPPVVNGRTEHTNEKESSEPLEVERNEELINSLVPNSLDIEQTKEKPVHGYCFTPSLAQRLAKAIERAYTKAQEEDEKGDLNSDDALGEDKDETESSVNDELEADEQNGKENDDGVDDGGEGGDGDE